MRITADDIYSINHSSLKDAIVLFGGGCTGEIVSDYGLLLTNHHCGFDYIQKHSSVEHDYLTDGFWAMDRSQELPCPGLSVIFLREMRDVTEKVLFNVTDDMTEEDRQATINENIKKITAEVEKQTEYKVSIKPYFLGNEYYLLLNEVYTDQYSIQQVQSNLTKNVKATPADVRKYYNGLPKDSLPFIPMQVEAQIITINPVIPQQEIDEVKARLRDYAQQVTSGEREFSTLAILYSQDQATAVYGGETGFQSRSVLLPEYANAAFNLNDSKRVSNIVETDDGYHIIQLIEKRGDRINTRHILLRPKVSDKDLTDAISRLDSVKADITAGKRTFDEMALLISQDKDSRNNNGNMLNEKNHSSRFEMADLPAEVGKKISTMQPGDISEPFVMINPKTRREQVAIVKLVKRIDGHKADLGEDYMIIKDMCEANTKEEILRNWVIQKQKSVYVYIEEGWRNCDFKYDWLKTGK